MRRWQQSSMKVRGLERAFRIENAVVREDPDRDPVEPREAGDERRAVQPLEFVELGGVHEPRDDFANVVLFSYVGRHDAVELGRVVFRLARLVVFEVDAFRLVQVRDDAAADVDRVLIVHRVVVGDTRLAGVHIRSAKLFGGDNLPCRGLHQGRTAEKDRSLPAHDDRFVRHRRHIRAAGGAGAHDGGDLRDAGGRKLRLIEEDAAEVLAVGKHLGLMRKVRAA